MEASPFTRGPLGVALGAAAPVSNGMKEWIQIPGGNRRGGEKRWLLHLSGKGAWPLLGRSRAAALMRKMLIREGRYYTWPP